jgi:hypothetical protein
MDKEIGEAAGKVWQTLSKSPVAPNRVAKVVGLPSDLANQALGWLAREGKLAVQDTPKGTVLKVRS